MLQHRALLYVKLKVSENIGRQFGFGNARRVEPEIADGAGDAADQVCVQTAHGSAAADERDAVPDAFFFGKADQLDGKGQGTGRQIFEQRHAQYNAQDAVECSRVGDGVEVRSDDEERGSRPRGHTRDAKIANGVDTNGAASLFGEV